MAPIKVVRAGISEKSIAPTAADHKSSVYRKGASAEASSKLNDFSRQYNNRFAPAPSIDRRPTCTAVGCTHDKYAGYAAIKVVKKAV